jgi:hypothetical protein
MLSKEFLELYADPGVRDGVASSVAGRGVEATAANLDGLAALGRLLLWPSLACVAIVCWAVLMAAAGGA